MIGEVISRTGRDAAGSDLPIPDYRVRFTVRNNRLLSAIEAAGYKTQSEFARAIGMSQTSLSALVAMRKAPIGASGEFTADAKAVMEALGSCPSDLWSDSQLTTTLHRNSGEFSIDHLEVQALLDRQVEAMVLPDPCDLLEEKEVSEKVSEQLSTLTEKERFVIQQRFGFGEIGPRTLEQIGNSLGVTSARVRQIEAKALRKLRHPTRRNQLVDVSPFDIYTSVKDDEIASARLAKQRADDFAEAEELDGGLSDAEPSLSPPGADQASVADSGNTCLECVGRSGPFAWIHPSAPAGICLACAQILHEKGTLAEAIRVLQSTSFNPE